MKRQHTYYVETSTEDLLRQLSCSKVTLPVQVYGIIEESIFQAFKAKQENAELIENVFLGTSGIPKHIYSINYIESYYRGPLLRVV